MKSHPARISFFFIFGFLGLVSLNEAAPNNKEPPQILKEDKNYWYNIGKDDLKKALNRQSNLRVAKNVIFFLGDGMGVSTITAARIHAGQKKGQPGEENFLNFEKFPNLGLLKTYNVDKQVPDSAGTATAYLTGVKGRYGTIGIDVSGPYNVCRSDLGTRPNVDSVMKWAQDAGKATGFVTTTRVTHATPAGLYAHTNSREWECDSQVPLANRKECKDIARQLIEDDPGRNARIILGGGRLPFEAAMDDGKTTDPVCKRGDNKDLINSWKLDKMTKRKKAAFLENRKDLLDLDLDSTDYVLGLFAPSHLPLIVDRNDTTDPKGVPGIEEMTEKAVRFLLKKGGDKGFFLLVEGGLIDYAHHLNRALAALEEAVAMDRAVSLAQKLTNAEETLIIVTADHSHTFNINGYPVRGNPITGLAGKKANDKGYNFTTLTYSSGPGFYMNVNKETKDPSKPWIDATQFDIQSKDYQQLSKIPAKKAFHGGEDVAVYATGPMAHLFYGVHEQNYVAHVMGHAACMGPYAGNCKVPGRANGAVSTHSQLPNFIVECVSVIMVMVGRNFY